MDRYRLVRPPKFSVRRNCELLGVKETLYRSRINKGWSEEDAYGIRKKPSERGLKPRAYLYKGEVLTLKAIAEKYGVSVGLLNGRVNQSKYSIEKAMSEEEIPNKKMYTVENVIGTLDALLEYFNISEERLNTELLNGLDVQEALSKISGEKEYDLNLKVTLEDLNYLFHVEIDDLTYNMHVLGYSLEEALGMKKSE